MIRDKLIQILIVDDDQDICSNLSDILAELGYETDTADCGEAAVGKFEQRSESSSGSAYDLCLLDFRMPGIDGMETYRQIRQWDPSVPAIMMTAYAGDDGVQRARATGTSVLRKPVDIRQLLSMIQDAVA